MTKNPSSIKIFLIPCCLFLFSFFLRLSLISKGPYHVDCLYLASQAQKTLETGQLQTFLWGGYNLTLFFATFFVWVSQLFGSNDAVQAVNLMSVIFSSLCIPAFYEFSKRILDRKTALLSSALLSTFPLFLSLSVFGTSQTPALFFLFLGLAFLQKYKDNARIKNLLLAGAAFGLAGACRAQDLIIMVLPIAYFYFVPIKKTDSLPSNPKRIFHFLTLSIITGLTVSLFQLPTILSQGTEPYQHMLKQFQQTALPSTLFNYGFLSTTLLRWNLIVITQELPTIALVLALAGFILLWRDHKGLFIFLLLWFLCPFLLYGNIHTSTSRYLLLPLLSFLLSAGYALAVLMKHKNKLFKIISFLVSFIVIAFFLLKIFPVLQFRHRFAVMPDFARWVATVTEPTATIVTADDCLFISYYGNRLAVPWPVNIYEDRQNFSTFQSWLDQQLAKQVPVYVRLSKSYNVPAPNHFIKFLNEKYRLKLIGAAPFEDWHHSTTKIRVISTRLFKIEPH